MRQAAPPWRKINNARVSPKFDPNWTNFAKSWSRRDPLDRVGTSNIGCAANIQAIRPESRPYPSSERPFSGYIVADGTSGRPLTTAIVGSLHALPPRTHPMSTARRVDVTSHNPNSAYRKAACMNQTHTARACLYPASAQQQRPRRGKRATAHQWAPADIQTVRMSPEAPPRRTSSSCRPGALCRERRSRPARSPSSRVHRGVSLRCRFRTRDGWRR